jgi:hypothetical protein
MATQEISTQNVDRDKVLKMMRAIRDAKRQSKPWEAATTIVHSAEALVVPGTQLNRGLQEKRATGEFKAQPQSVVIKKDEKFVDEDIDREGLTRDLLATLAQIAVVGGAALEPSKPLVGSKAWHEERIRKTEEIVATIPVLSWNKDGAERPVKLVQPSMEIPVYQAMGTSTAGAKTVEAQNQ